MKVTPIAAYCAVGPDGKLDIDMVRRAVPAAQWAAGAVLGTTWAALGKRGWRVIAVRIGAADDAEEAAEPARRATMTGRVSMASPVTRDVTGEAPASAPRPVRPARTAGDGRMALLRAGELP